MHFVAFEDIYGREVIFNVVQITKMKAVKESKDHPCIVSTKIYTSDGECELIPLELDDVTKRILAPMTEGVLYA